MFLNVNPMVIHWRPHLPLAAHSNVAFLGLLVLGYCVPLTWLSLSGYLFGDHLVLPQDH